MAYSIKGNIFNACHCHGICPCNVDETPNGPNGECKGLIFIDIKEGSQDDVDLSGVKIGFAVNFPGNPTGGNWRVGLIVDEAASDEQAAAIEKVMKGDDGGPWEEFAGLRSEWLGVERAAVSLSNGDSASGEIAGVGQAAFEPYRDGEGNPTKLKDASFGLAPEFTIGKASGSVDAFGISFDATYGEAAEFEFAS